MNNKYHQNIEKQEVLDQEVEWIRRESLHMDQTGLLSPGVLDFIYKKNWLSVMEPKFCGGREWELPQIFSLFEELAYVDGNLGWNVNLGAGANLFSGYFDQKVARTIFTGPKIWLAGSGAKSGKAIPVDGGYLVSGRWKYASGSRYATHFTANCVLENADSNSFLSFIFPAEEVQIYDTWKVSGLRATVSNEFEVKNLFVPGDHSFSLIRPSGFSTAPIFHFPFETLAVVNMVSMITGMTLHFLELFEELMIQKTPLNSPDKLGNSYEVQRAYEHWKSSFLDSRDQFLGHLSVLWERFNLVEGIDNRAFKSLEKEGRGLVSLSRNLMRYLTPYCGMDLVFEASPLNKLWRDLTVAGQHYLLV